MSSTYLGLYVSASTVTKSTVDPRASFNSQQRNTQLGGGLTGIFSWKEIEPFLTDFIDGHCNSTFKYIDHVSTHSAEY